MSARFGAMRGCHCERKTIAIEAEMSVTLQYMESTIPYPEEKI
jgi:hypothetical protein